MKNSKKIIAITITALMIVLTVGNIVIYGESSGGGYSSRNIQGPVFSDTPVYILGESLKTNAIKQELRPVTSDVSVISQEMLPSKISPERDILAIDGMWLTTVSLEETTENLRPVVLQGTPVLLLAKQSTLLDDVIAKLEPSMELVHSDDESIVIYGLKYYPETGAVASLEISCKDAEDEIIKAYEWARKYLSNIPIYPEPEHHSPWWQWRYTQTYYGSFSPYGQFNIVNDFFRLEEDGTGTYKWYNAHYRVESVPGYTAYGNDWKTSSIFNDHKSNGFPGTGSNILNDYDPTTSSGTSTVSVSIGVSMGENGAAVSAGQSWAYTVSDVSIISTSNFANQYAAWEHVLDKDTNVAKYTFKCEPGSTDRAPEGGGYGINDFYQITWAKWVWRIWPIWGYWYTHTFNIMTTGYFT